MDNIIGEKPLILKVSYPSKKKKKSVPSQASETDWLVNKIICII